jgi:DNA primase
MATRYDFKHVREHADFQTILNHYGIETQQDGTKAGQIKALCPFHDDTKPSLKVNLERKIYHCFPCEAKGNVLDFVMAREGCEIREAASIVVDVCGISPNPSVKPGRKQAAEPLPARQAKPETPAPAPDGDGVAYNKILSFELQLTRPTQLIEWLASRGIGEDAVELFGLGLASKKSKTIGDRLAIPFHSCNGELIGYCGRYVGDDVPEDVPKYVLPKGFHKELELFNLNRISASDTKGYVILAESYLSVLRHFPALPIASPCGRSISPEQVALLRERGFTRAVVVGDGDEPGRAGAIDIAGALAPHMWARVVEIEDGVKPHHLETEKFAEMLRRHL